MQLRNPVQRVLSAYEFGIEVAARKVHVSEAQHERSKQKGSINTLNVWPWTYVVQWFRDDMRRRVGRSVWAASGVQLGRADAM
jgi:hypothetical protein